jgi:hypothetical protein
VVAATSATPVLAAPDLAEPSGSCSSTNICRHFPRAVRRGWPRRLVLDRRGAHATRDRVLEDIPIREGFDRHEYRRQGLTRGRNPRSGKASLHYNRRSENRSSVAGLASLGDRRDGRDAMRGKLAASTHRSLKLATHPLGASAGEPVGSRTTLSCRRIGGCSKARRCAAGPYEEKV